MLLMRLMIGVSGSGKSTYAKKMFSGEIILSSDKLRGVLGSSESDQSVNYAVFSTLKNMAAYFLSLGKNVVIDATNVSPKSRADFIYVAKKYNARIIAYYVKVPIEECIKRNNQRDRIVPEEAIHRQFRSLSLPESTEVDELVVIENVGAL
jgi:protein phosphatase